MAKSNHAKPQSSQTAAPTTGPPYIFAFYHYK